MSSQVTEHAHWHTSPYPILVGFGAGFLLPWAFMFYFVYGQGLLAVIALGLGLLMLLVGGVGWVGETVGIIDDEGWSPAAMLMFIGTEVMTLFAILVGYWVMRLQAPQWPPEGTPEISAPNMATLLLLFSSLSIGLARRKQMQGDAAGFANLTLISIAIWALFALMTIFGWGQLAGQGFAIGVNAYATALYGLTGIHFAHIVFGLLIMLLALAPAYRGRLSASYARSMTMYVHFVNVLGIWVLLQAYYW
ncbi:MAG: cytochrome c oxidase subunit 3 [Mariprofundaceae bacterium]|nr:cytochrome c oxidase subunit 3 [Mariprofundaceae bacterium]